MGLREARHDMAGWGGMEWQCMSPGMISKDGRRWNGSAYGHVGARKFTEVSCCHSRGVRGRGEGGVAAPGDYR